MGGSFFGVEAAMPASGCTGGSPAANYVDAVNKVAIGAVPVRALGLSNDYAVDGLGRLITYAVDTTTTSPCAWAGTVGIFTPHISVNDNGVVNNTVAVLVSHGSNGHGAWIPLTGSTGSGSRLNAGSNDADKLTNAHVDASFNPVTPLANFVRKTTTASFDDLVVYQSPFWNIAKQPDANPVCAYVRPLRVNHTHVSGPLANFPVLVNITDTTLKSTSNGGHVIYSTGSDITFTADPALINLLSWETEYYNPTTGQLIAWVSIPSLSNAADTTFYLSYGNYKKVTQQSTPSSVWDNSFINVWHLGNGAALSATDSTVTGTNGVFQNAPAATPGQIYGAVSFNGGNNINLGTYNPFPTGVGTMSAWFKMNSPAMANDYLIAKGDDAGPVSMGIDIIPNNSATSAYIAFLYGSAQWVGTPLITINSGWNHIAVVATASNTQSIYLNGSLLVTGGLSAITPDLNGGFNIAKTDRGSPYQYYAPADIDEVRLEVPRSAAWIATEYSNQSAPASFIALGLESVQVR